MERLATRVIAVQLTPVLTTSTQPTPATTVTTGSRRVIAALAAVSLIWGTSFLGVRVMVETMPPLFAGAIRFLTAGVFLLAVLAITGFATGMRRPLFALGWRAHAACAFVGVCLVGAFCLVGLSFGEQMTSGLAALLYASVPLWIVLLRVLVDRHRIARATIAGVVGGFMGVAILLAPGRASGTLLGVTEVLAAAATWAFGSFVATRLPLPDDVLVSAGWQMTWGSALGVAASVAAGEHIVVADVSAQSWAALAYLAVISSGVAFTSYGWLLRNAPLSLTATWSYISPLIAVFAGALVLGEPLRHATLAGMVLIAVSVAATIRAESDRSSRPDIGAYSD
jgi:drug/metabolite transporter (DMT)-like permease